MSNIMTKRGNQDNVVTYEHICDKTEDMQNIDKSQITLGSVCIVLEGANGLEVYMANSKKEWINLLGGSTSTNTSNNSAPAQDLDDSADDEF